jgi:hypothetical protein
MTLALVQLAVIAAFGAIVVLAVRRHLFLRNGDWHFAEGSRERRFVGGRWEYRDVAPGNTEGHNDAGRRAQ